MEDVEVTHSGGGIYSAVVSVPDASGALSVVNSMRAATFTNSLGDALGVTASITEAPSVYSELVVTPLTIVPFEESNSAAVGIAALLAVVCLFIGMKLTCRWMRADVPDHKGHRDLTLSLRGDYAEFRRDKVAQDALRKKLAAIGNIDPHRVKILSMQVSKLCPKHSCSRMHDRSTSSSLILIPQRTRALRVYLQAGSIVVSVRIGDQSLRDRAGFARLPAGDLHKRILKMTPAALGHALGHRVILHTDSTLYNDDGTLSVLKQRIRESIIWTALMSYAATARRLFNAIEFSWACLKFYYVLLRSCSLKRAQVSPENKPKPSPPQPVRPQRQPSRKSDIASAAAGAEARAERAEAAWTSGKSWLSQRILRKSEKEKATRNLQASAKDLVEASRNAVKMSSLRADPMLEDEDEVDRSMLEERPDVSENCFDKDSEAGEDGDEVDDKEQEYERPIDERLVLAELSIGSEGNVILTFGRAPIFVEEDAAVTVQSQMRVKVAKGKKEKKKKEKKVQEDKEESAAITVQKEQRKKNAKKETAEKRQEKQEGDAATTVQKEVRKSKAKKELAEKKQEKQEIDAATTVQKEVRKGKAKKELAEKKQEKQEIDAATTVQKEVRKSKAKKELAEKKQEKQEIDAATTVQKEMRKSKAKKEVAEKRQEKQEEMEENAAIVVQKEQRKKTAKKELAEKKQEKQEEMEDKAAIVVQKEQRKKKAKKELAEKKQEKVEQDVAATVVQKGARMQKAKKEKELRATEKALPAAERKERNEAATKVQAQVRSNKAKEKTALLKEERELPDEERVVRNDAATKLQSKQRAKNAKADIVPLKKQKEREERERNEPVGKISLAMGIDAEGKAASAVDVKSDSRTKKDAARAAMEKKVAVVEAKLEHQKQTAAAKVVQTRTRGANAKKELAQKKQGKQETEAAVKLQGRTRVHQAQSQVKAMQFEKQLASESKAATAVQSRARVVNAKKERKVRAKDKKDGEAAVIVQKNLRFANARKEVEGKKQEKKESQAAVMLQGRARVHQAQSERKLLARDKAENAAAVVVQSKVRGAQAKGERAARAAAKQDAEELQASTALQARVRGRQGRAQGAAVRAERAAEKVHVENGAAARVQARVRGQRAKSEVHDLKIARREARKQAETSAAMVVQSHSRGRKARATSRLLSDERDLPDDEKRARAAAATRISASRRRQSAKAEQHVRQAERQRRRQEQEDAAKALQAIMRVRKARAQRKLMQDAKDLGETLGISKWAALWMLRPQAEEEEATASAPAEAPAGESLWERLTEGVLPDPVREEIPPDSDSEDEHSLQGLTDEEDEPFLPPTPRGQRLWRLLRENLARALDVERRRMGVSKAETAADAATRFARSAKEKLELLKRFKAQNPNYPFGPTPHVLPNRLKPVPGAAGSLERLRLQELTAVPPVSDDGQRRAATALGGSHSEASLRGARPVTVDSPTRTLRASQSSAQLPPLASPPPQYGTSPRMPPRLLPEPGERRRQPPPMPVQRLPTAWAPAAAPVAALAAAPAMGLSALDVCPPALALAPAVMPLQPHRAHDDDAETVDDEMMSFGRPGSAGAVVRAARGTERAVLPSETVRMVQRFQSEQPQYPAFQPAALVSSPSLPALRRLPPERLPQRSTDDDMWAGARDARGQSDSRWASRVPSRERHRSSTLRGSGSFLTLPPEHDVAPRFTHSQGEMDDSEQRPMSHSGLRTSVTHGDLLRQSAPASVLRPTTSHIELRGPAPGASLMNMASPFEYGRRMTPTPGVPRPARSSRDFPRLPADLQVLDEPYTPAQSDATYGLGYGDMPVPAVRARQQTRAVATPLQRRRQRPRTPVYFIDK